MWQFCSRRIQISMLLTMAFLQGKCKVVYLLIKTFCLGNPEHHRRVRAMSGVSSNDDSAVGPMSAGWMNLEGDQSQPNSFNLETQENIKTERDEDGSVGAYFSGNSEHAYSTASKTPLIKQPKYVLQEKFSFSLKFRLRNS